MKASILSDADSHSIFQLERRNQTFTIAFILLHPISSPVPESRYACQRRRVRGYHSQSSPSYTSRHRGSVERMWRELCDYFSQRGMLSLRMSVVGEKLSKSRHSRASQHWLDIDLVSDTDTSSTLLVKRIDTCLSLSQ